MSSQQKIANIPNRTKPNQTKPNNAKLKWNLSFNMLRPYTQTPHKRTEHISTVKNYSLLPFGDFYQPEKCLTNNSHTYWERDGGRGREGERENTFVFVSSISSSWFHFRCCWKMIWTGEKLSPWTPFYSLFLCLLVSVSRCSYGCKKHET